MMRSLVAPVEGSLRARVESALTSGTRPPTLLERRNLRQGCVNSVDDCPKGTEVTTVAAAQQLAGSARLQPRALAVPWAGRRVAPGWCV